MFTIITKAIAYKHQYDGFQLSYKYIWSISESIGTNGITQHKTAILFKTNEKLFSMTLKQSQVLPYYA